MWRPHSSLDCGGVAVRTGYEYKSESPVSHASPGPTTKH